MAPEKTPLICTLVIFSAKHLSRSGPTYQSQWQLGTWRDYTMALWRCSVEEEKGEVDPVLATATSLSSDLLSPALLRPPRLLPRRPLPTAPSSSVPPRAVYPTRSCHSSPPGPGVSPSTTCCCTLPSSARFRRVSRLEVIGRNLLLLQNYSWLCLLVFYLTSCLIE